VLDSVQNAIDKTSGVFGPISFSEINGFVDGDFRGNLCAIEEFKNSHPEDISFNKVDTI